MGEPKVKDVSDDFLVEEAARERRIITQQAVCVHLRA
jgi:hypothetical protein